MEDDHTSIAVVTIKKAADMSDEGRHEIAEWLRRQADGIEEDGNNYADRFRARYRIPKE